MTIQPGSKVLESEIGILSGGYTAIQGYTSVEGSVEAVAFYEDILYYLQGLLGVVNPTGSGPYVYTYQAPISDVPNVAVYTLEYGLPGYAYKFQDALVSSLKISGEAGDDPEIRVEADILAGQFAAGPITNLAVRNVNPITMLHGQLFMDIWAGTMGSTAVNATLIKFELDVNPNRHLKFFQSRFPSGWGDDGWEGKLNLQLEYNSTAQALVTELVTGYVQRQIELRFTDSPNSMKIQFAGTLTGEPELWSDRDGNMVVELEFSATYHSTLANWLKVIVTNGVATIP
jgi:hypothetical protein